VGILGILGILGKTGIPSIIRKRNDLLAVSQLFRNFVFRMFNIKRSLVWLGRLPRSCGFGIQSPTDYRFMRYVINDHWPYYAYNQLGLNDDKLRKKIGLLCFRLANERQPQVIVDRMGLDVYLTAGCRRSTVVQQTDLPIELAVVPMDEEGLVLLGQCDERSVIVYCNIKTQPKLWHSVKDDARTVVTFDLYDCGIALFDKHQSKNNYKVNF